MTYAEMLTKKSQLSEQEKTFYSALNWGLTDEIRENLKNISMLDYEIIRADQPSMHNICTNLNIMKLVFPLLTEDEKRNLISYAIYYHCYATGIIKWFITEQRHLLTAKNVLEMLNACHCYNSNINFLYSEHQNSFYLGYDELLKFIKSELPNLLFEALELRKAEYKKWGITV